MHQNLCPLARGFVALASLPVCKLRSISKYAAIPGHLPIKFSLSHRSTATRTTLLPLRSIMSSSDGTSGAVVVYVTVPSRGGEKIAALLVNPDHRLSSMRQHNSGLTSIYWWNGEVQKDSELLLMIETETRLVPKLTEVVKSNHPYDECEVISLPIVGGSASYIQWIHNSVSG